VASLSGKLALLSATFGLASAHAQPTPEAVPANPYYPKAALAAGVSGLALLKCERTEHGGFKGCQIAQEAPEGEGFGAAAMSMASNAAECPTLKLSPEQRSAGSMRFWFTASSGTISPNVVSPDWPMRTGDWLRHPNTSEMLRVLPPSLAHVSARVALLCENKASSQLGQCRVIAEAPANQGFGEAALKLTGSIKISASRDCAGAPVDDLIVVPIGWRADTE
jgi:hypothetical protein